MIFVLFLKVFFRKNIDFWCAIHLLFIKHWRWTCKSTSRIRRQLAINSSPRSRFVMRACQQRKRFYTKSRANYFREPKTKFFFIKVSHFSLVKNLHQAYELNLKYDLAGELTRLIIPIQVSFAVLFKLNYRPFSLSFLHLNIQTFCNTERKLEFFFKHCRVLIIKLN